MNITSIIGQIGNVAQANYAVSKAGLAAFTKSLAKEVLRQGHHGERRGPRLHGDRFAKSEEVARAGTLSRGSRYG